MGAKKYFMPGNNVIYNISGSSLQRHKRDAKPGDSCDYDSDCDFAFGKCYEDELYEGHCIITIWPIALIALGILGIFITGCVVCFCCPCCVLGACLT